MYILLYYDVGSLCSPPHWPAPTVPHHWSCTWLHAPLTSGEPPSHLWRPSRWRQVNAVNPGRVGLGGWWWRTASAPPDWHAEVPHLDW